MGIFSKQNVPEPTNAPLHLYVEKEKILPLRIPVVDDYMVNQKVALLLLERLGYRADIAANGLEAIQALERQPYDVILMDMQMPEMDGLEATRHICTRWSKYERPWIIAMTANVMQTDREQCLAAGMNDFIAKPIDSMQMLTTLVKWVVPAHPQVHPSTGSKAVGTEELPILPEVAVEEAARRMGGSADSYYSVLLLLVVYLVSITHTMPPRTGSTATFPSERLLATREVVQGFPVASTCTPQ